MLLGGSSDSSELAAYVVYTRPILSAVRPLVYTERVVMHSWFTGEEFPLLKGSKLKESVSASILHLQTHRQY